MIQEKTCDVAVIGAGAAGLAAAAECANAGLAALAIDREDAPGGILRQCIHNGFGLRYFKEELTGPEYAQRVARKAEAAGVEFALGHTVTGIERKPEGGFTLTCLSAADGVTRVGARAIMLAMGCRERNRGNLAIPGTRPAGIFTAGSAQKLLNMEGMLPGRSAVIVGSGDIGLIMARRLRWSGVEVKAVVEIMPTPSGLPRNIAQCLEDFGIPLYLEHSVVEIRGRERVESIDVAPLEEGVPNLDRKFTIVCDTLLFSVGLLPENELVTPLGVAINPATGGAIVDAGYQTSVPGIFAGGNVLHVHDLVDFVSLEAELAARSIVRYLAGNRGAERCPVVADANLKYAIPNYFTPGEDTRFSFRPLLIRDRAELEAELDGNVIWKRIYPSVRPAEMIVADIPGKLLNAPGTLRFRLRTEEKESC